MMGFWMKYRCTITAMLDLTPNLRRNLNGCIIKYLVSILRSHPTAAQTASNKKIFYMVITLVETLRILIKKNIQLIESEPSCMYFQSLIRYHLGYKNYSGLYIVCTLNCIYPLPGIMMLHLFNCCIPFKF